ncbi:MAG: hypothetical protein KAJ73_05395, partial [Zetaproteobacteria bacterium]|nr:hypothetical protein [Zetaproteobacteria bacterium]
GFIAAFLVTTFLAAVAFGPEVLFVTFFRAAVPFETFAVATFFFAAPLLLLAVTAFFAGAFFFSAVLAILR